MFKDNRRVVLFTLAFLYIFGESTLAPFYPQFFEKEFGVSSPHLTGAYLMVCRFAVVLSAPLWGIMSQKYKLTHMLPVAQIAAIVAALGCYFSDSLWFFFGASLLLVTAKCSALLLYPELLKGRSSRVQVICNVHLLANIAVLVATVAGIWVMGLASPRTAFLIAAGLELMQLGLCLLLKEKSKEEKQEPTSARSDSIPYKQWFAQTGSLLLMSYCALQLIRPFFTKFITDEAGLSLLQSGICFLVPFAVAAPLLYLIGRTYKGGRYMMLISVGLTVFVFSLLGQVATGSQILLWSGRVLMGIVTVLLPLAFDEKVFSEAAEGSSSKVYSWSFALQNLALIIAPLCSALLVEWGSLYWPFYASLILTLVTLFKFTLYLQSEKNNVEELTV
ncbi:MAG: MFS transporter [Lentisphaerales bacterium]|nr:MFS transporter [Lentisphaerales bacterium]